MKERKKVLIFGLIGDFGGIAVEVRLIAQLLSEVHKVALLSSNKITENSSAVIKHKNFIWNYIGRKIYSENILIKISSRLTKHINKRSEEADSFIGNKLSHKFYDFEKLHLNIIENAVIDNDLIIFFGHFESKWLKEMMEFSHLNNKPFIFRTTGTIRDIPANLASCFKDHYKILVHSKLNLKILKKNAIDNGFVVDQTSYLEQRLLEIDTKLINRRPVYGYLGRFGKEKGILEFLAIMKSLKKPVVLAGDGLLLKEVKNFTDDSKNIVYMGKLAVDEIATFFKKIDVLVIPSFEESGPLVGIEAMAAGKLIISTRVGATVDRLEGNDNQFWFDIKNPESLVNTIVQVETLPLESLQKIKLQLREKYLLKYSNSSLSAQYNEVFKEYLS